VVCSLVKRPYFFSKRMLSSFLVVVALMLVVVASASRVQMEVSHPRFMSEPTLRRHVWKASASAPAAKTIQLTFALKQQNIPMLEQKLSDISSPHSKNYGKHMSLAEINALTEPTADAKNAVVSFLKSFGVNKYEYSSGFLRATVPVSVAESMLEAKYQQYEHAVSGQSAMRVDSYSLPEEVARVVSFVAPTVNFPAAAFKPMPVLTTEDAPEAAYQNTPDNLRSLYSVGSAQASGNTKNRQAATAFLEQYYKEKDLQSFYDKYYPTLSGTPMANVVGPNGAKGGVEAALDVEYITVMGSGVPSEFWSFSGRQPDNDENEPFLDWLYLLGNTTDAPYVFSTSYGEDEWSVTYDYSERMNEEFLEGGLRGISFLFASGDSGVGSAFGSCTTFTPMFPADSPYVTAVGATTKTNPETGASLSSGGFSNRWAMPSWQAEAVANYLKTGPNLPDSSLFNATSRAFPDVSAQGTDYPVINNGQTLPSVAGTSASCPVFAGIIGLLNDARLVAGKAPLGFLNPWLYAYGITMLNDVTSGNNPGCGTKGFTASAGWDPVTGNGTPNFQKMLSAALALP
jgi:tripeptidyl-peptidase-1